MAEEKSLKQQLEEINEKLDNVKKPKEKKFKLPFSSKVSNTKLKKGYISVEVINENKEIGFEKQPIVDGTIKLSSGDIHAIDELDIFTYKGKPFAHIPKTKINGWNPLSKYLDEERSYDGKVLDKNEIYGQKYVMARMKSDIITGAKKMGWGITIFGLIIIGVIAYAFITGK